MTDQTGRVVVVASIAEALSHLATQRGRARIVAGVAGLAGGLNLPADVYLVDVSEVAALRRIERADGAVLLGGAVLLATLAKHSEVDSAAPLLSLAAAHHAQSGRGAETLGARVVSARGGDPINVALVALNAQAEITNLTGAQWLPVASLYVRQGVSRVDSSSEILTRLRVTAASGPHGAGVGAIPCEGDRGSYTLAMTVVLSEDGERFTEVRLAHGADWMIPSSLDDVAEMLVGVALDDKERLRAFVASLVAQAIAQMSQEEREGIDEDAFRKACHVALKGATCMARGRLAQPSSQ